MTNHPTWRIWTSAPADYDYAYCTRTGRMHPEVADLYEVLATTVRVNAEGQCMRYQSGLYAATLDPVPVPVPHAPTLNEVLIHLRKLCPNAVYGLGVDGQVILYTDMKCGLDERMVSL